MTKIVMKYLGEKHYEFFDDRGLTDYKTRGVCAPWYNYMLIDVIADFNDSVDEVDYTKNYREDKFYIVHVPYTQNDKIEKVERWKNKFDIFLNENKNFLSLPNVHVCIGEIMECPKTHAETFDYFIVKYPYIKFFAVTIDKKFNSKHGKSFYDDRWKNRFQPYGDVIKYNPKKLYINLTRVARYHRCLLLDHLIEKNLFNDGYNTWGNVFDEFQFYKKMYPNTQIDRMKFDVLDITDLSNTMPTNSVPNECSESFLFLNTETNVENDTLLLSEKVYKPLGVGMPFMTLGNPGTIQELRNKGYITFEYWWDESYDNDYPIEHRIKIIVDNLKKLKKYDTASLLDIRKEMNYALKYNLELYTLSRKKNTLKEALLLYARSQNVQSFS